MNNKIVATNKDIVFYKKDNGDTNIELLINGATLWVNQKTMAEIFDVDRTVITKHLKNIFNDGELKKIKYVQNLHILQMMEKHIIWNFII